MNESCPASRGRRVVCLLLAAAASAAACRTPAPRSALLITIDTLRADYLSSYGHRTPTSPHIDRLALRGRRYEHALSAFPLTVPSHASILTGKYPSFHTVGLDNGGRRLDPAARTLAELARDGGFSTAAIVSNYVLRAEVGLDQGFETYDDRFEDREVNRPQVAERHAERAVDLALSWLEANRGPFFVWLHLQDPHGPYRPPGEFSCPLGTVSEAGQKLAVGAGNTGFRSIPRYQVVEQERGLEEYRRRYECEIAYLDHHLGRLLSLLDEDREYSETLVALTADHGEAFGEDDYFFGHGHSVGLDQMHVPLILAGPGIAAGEVVSAPVSNVGLFATLLAHLGLEGREQPMVGELPAAEPAGGPPILVEGPGQIGAVIGSTLLRRDRPAGERQGWGRRFGPELTALGSSAGASRALLPRLTAALDRFEARARSSRRALEARREEVQLDDTDLEHLRSLGYLD